MKTNALRVIHDRRQAVNSIPDAERESLTHLIATTVAGFKSTFGCKPERFEHVRNAQGRIIGVACTGEIDADRLAPGRSAGAAA